MAGTSNLRIAKTAKKDEFYTQLSDIEKELRHYVKHFRGKIVLCNCDDPFESNFSKYFFMNFNSLGLKKLICTCWDGSPITGQQLDLFDEKPQRGSRSRVAYKIEITEIKDLTGDGAVGVEDVAKFLKKNPPEKLNGNGDFRSKECIELLQEADIVVTNPPFSLFREYVAQLVKYDKKFLVIGNMNYAACKEIFPLVKENKIWLGFHSGHTLFAVPNDYEIPDFYDKSDRQKLRSNGYIIDEKGKLWRNLGNICWFTNLDHDKRHDPIDLYEKYSPEKYPKYDNYDAIEVCKASNIPVDYDGIMGVSTSFLEKYCPEQFEVLGVGSGNMAKEIGVKKNYRGRTDLAYTINGKSQCPFGRILIRKLNNKL